MIRLQLDIIGFFPLTMKTYPLTSLLQFLIIILYKNIHLSTI